MEPKPCVRIYYSQASAKGEPLFLGILNDELRRKPVECFAGDVKSVELRLWPMISDNSQVKEEFMNYSKHKAQTSNLNNKRMPKPNIKTDKVIRKSVKFLK